VAVRLLLSAYDAAGLDVRADFGVGNSNSVGRCTVPSPAYRPAIPARRELRCGTIEPFARLAGEPALDLSLLLIARQDVKSARNGLWHLRPELAAAVTDPQLRRMLTYGRAGELFL
jgi:hypothetical protein